MSTHVSTRPLAHRLLMPLVISIVGLLAIAGLLVLAIIAFSDEKGMGIQQEVTLTEDDAGSALLVANGGEIIVRLQSNITTGYEWEVAAVDSDLLQFLGSTYEAPQNGIVGQAGIQELRFRALAEGETPLELKYWRPWEGEAGIANRFEVQIDIIESD